jgi:hypothetical protein
MKTKLKKNDVPFFAIGSNELKDKPIAGETAICPNCKKNHKIKFGTNIKTKKEDKMLGFVNCGKESFLVSINNQLI